MSVGGFRTIALGAILLTVGLSPLTASQGTCGDAGPVELCVDDPLVHDAGEANIEDGDVSAEANGGVVAGAGSATFVLDYRADASGLSGDLSYHVKLVVYDDEGGIVGLETAFDTLASGETVEDELRIQVDTVAPLVDGGSIEVEARGGVLSGGDFSRVGAAHSVSPITYVVAPPEDVAERTSVGETVDVGSFDVGPGQQSAQALDDELIVAGNTGVKLQASGQLESRSFDGVDNLQQDAGALLSVRTADFDVFLSSAVQPIRDSCSSSCSVDARTAEVDLSVVFPGDAEDPQREVEIRVRGQWGASWHDGSQFHSDGAFAFDRGDNELIAVGT